MSFSKALAATAVMATTIIAMTLATLTFLAGQANAQSIYGDTQLSYLNGVVYDDDLVPGRAPNQPYLVGESSGSGGFSGGFSSSVQSSSRSIPAYSRNLIGRDGRSSRDRPNSVQR